MKNGVIIQGSSRSDGNTSMIASRIGDLCDFETIDLCEKEIGSFDYEFRNSGDDFLPLIKDVIGNFETIVFATPVYWYSMSGLMKNFVDRFTELLRTEKELGRQLRGKNMAMISCGSDKNVPDYFAGPFQDTAGYLGMNYLGELHAWVESGEIRTRETNEEVLFADKLQKKRV